MFLKDGGEMTNIEDPNQAAPSGRVIRVNIVCPDLSV